MMVMLMGEQKVVYRSHPSIPESQDYVQGILDVVKPKVCPKKLCCGVKGGPYMFLDTLGILCSKVADLLKLFRKQGILSFFTTVASLGHREAEASCPSWPWLQDSSRL